MQAIMTAEEARKIAEEARNSEERKLERARQQVKADIERVAKSGSILQQTRILNYDDIPKAIWQELRDLGYKLTKEDIGCGYCMKVEW